MIELEKKLDLSLAPSGHYNNHQFRYDELKRKTVLEIARLCVKNCLTLHTIHTGIIYILHHSTKWKNRRVLDI